jgi:hypothetical protein
MDSQHGSLPFVATAFDSTRGGSVLCLLEALSTHAPHDKQRKCGLVGQSRASMRLAAKKWRNQIVMLDDEMEGYRQPKAHHPFPDRADLVKTGDWLDAPAIRGN